MLVTMYNLTSCYKVLQPENAVTVQTPPDTTDEPNDVILQTQTLRGCRCTHTSYDSSINPQTMLLENGIIRSIITSLQRRYKCPIPQPFVHLRRLPIISFPPNPDQPASSTLIPILLPALLDRKLLPFGVSPSSNDHYFRLTDPAQIALERAPDDG